MSKRDEHSFSFSTELVTSQIGGTFGPNQGYFWHLLLCNGSGDFCVNIELPKGQEMAQTWVIIMTLIIIICSLRPYLVDI